MKMQKKKKKITHFTQLKLYSGSVNHNEIHTVYVLFENDFQNYTSTVEASMEWYPVAQ